MSTDLTRVVETADELAAVCDEIAAVVGRRDVALTHVAVEQIRVDGRHRRDFGDIGELAASIKDVGLLNPIAVTPDLRLVAGGRRLRAYEYLGWPAIPVRVVNNLADAAALLRAERDENTCRKDMLPSEKAALGEALFAIERVNAERRNLEALARGRASQGRGNDGKFVTSASDPDVGKVACVRKAQQARDDVGEALGMSGRSYSDLRFAYQLATDEERPEEERRLGQDALDAMDAGIGVAAAAKKARIGLRARQEAQEVKAAALAESEPESDDTDPTLDPVWVPTAKDRGPKAAARRRELIRELAPQGWSSKQIGDHIGMLAETVRDIAREEGVALPADESLGRGHKNKKIDSNRIVRETVNSLSGLEMGLDLINFSDLDKAEIENWTVSLTQSIRVLNRLNKKLKEMVQ